MTAPEIFKEGSYQMQLVDFRWEPLLHENQNRSSDFYSSNE
jgi:hypothetical protein